VTEAHSRLVESTISTRKRNFIRFAKVCSPTRETTSSWTSPRRGSPPRDGQGALGAALSAEAAKTRGDSRQRLDFPSRFGPRDTRDCPNANINDFEVLKPFDSQCVSMATLPRRGARFHASAA